jgi:hypothetical protein
VTSPARRWYTYPDQQRHLVLVGYDEGTDFSNDAHCVSNVDNLKLTVDVVSNDPTPTLTPTPTPWPSWAPAGTPSR